MKMWCIYHLDDILVSCDEAADIFYRLCDIDSNLLQLLSYLSMHLSMQSCFLDQLHRSIFTDHEYENTVLNLCRMVVAIPQLSHLGELCFTLPAINIDGHLLIRALPLHNHSAPWCSSQANMTVIYRISCHLSSCRLLFVKSSLT